MANKTDQSTKRTKGKATQHLDVIPKGWFARDLEPNAKIQGRFFVFRPDTPDADLHELENPGDAIDCQWTRYSQGGQTVYEVTLTARPPGWGQTLKESVALAARYGNVEEMVSIPYELRSRNLAECVSEILWLGPVDKGESISRSIMLHTNPQRNVTMKAISAPLDIKVHVHKEDKDSNRIPVECVFSSTESGLRRDTIKLLALDSEGNEQSVKLYYCAYVRP